MADNVIQDIAVDQDKKKIVSDSTERILLLFNVRVALSAPESAGIQWVQLEGRKEDIENAKNYINSLCNPEIKDVKVAFPEEYFDAIAAHRNQIERTSGAVVLFSSRTEACIQGSEIMAVVMASSAIESRITELKAGAIGASSLVNRGSIPPQPKCEQEKTQRSPIPYIDPSLEEFAIKLGYTKEDIHQVVKQQGKEVDQNTLLQELIKVSSPSLLQRAKPEYAVHTGLNKPVSYHRDEVVARGAPSRPIPKLFQYESSTSQMKQTQMEDSVPRGSPSRGIPKSFPFEGSTSQMKQTQKEDIVARGAVCRPPSRPFPLEASSLQSVMPKTVNDVDALMYQVISNGSILADTTSDLRHIVIDGSNVAMSHGNQQCFSCMGIRICVDYFKKRGHKEITVFVPQWRKEAPRPDAPIRNQEILAELEAERHLVYTPSRRVNGRRIVCYDDRFILKLASNTDGIVVSNDHFRDLFNESPEWKEVIEQRILMYSFVNDILMVPDDPLGRHGPKLDDFLRKGTATHKRVCPYLRRCTYGPRCRFYHPERDYSRKEAEGKKISKPVTDGRTHREYVEQYPPSMNGNQAVPFTQQKGPLEHERPLNSSNGERWLDDPRATTFQVLETFFPDQRDLIIRVMRENPHANKDYLAHLILNSYSNS